MPAPQTPGPNTPLPGGEIDPNCLASFSDDQMSVSADDRELLGGCSPDPVYVTDCEECRDRKDERDDANDGRRNACMDRAEARAVRQCEEGRLRGQISVPPEVLINLVDPFGNVVYRSPEFTLCMQEWVYGWDERTDRSDRTTTDSAGVEAGWFSLGFRDAEGQTRIISVGPTDGGYGTGCDRQLASFDQAARREFEECAATAEQKARDDGNNRFSCGG